MKKRHPVTGCLFFLTIDDFSKRHRRCQQQARAIGQENQRPEGSTVIGQGSTEPSVRHYLGLNPAGFLPCMCRHLPAGFSTRAVAGSFPAFLCRAGGTMSSDISRYLPRRLPSVRRNPDESGQVFKGHLQQFHFIHGF